jgi:hypothetical protein
MTLWVSLLHQRTHRQPHTHPYENIEIVIDSVTLIIQEEKVEERKYHVFQVLFNESEYANVVCHPYLISSVSDTEKQVYKLR